MEEIFIYIDNIIDERQEWKVVHKLKDIVVIVLFGTLANADDWVEIEIFAKANKAMLKKFITLENGIPSHDTIQRVMSSINPEVFKRLVGLWNEMLSKNEGEKLKKILCIDGKTMRGNGNKNQEPLHIVSAWSKESGVCFGQTSENSKGKEIPMIMDLLNTISVKNQVVTIDAIGTQTKIAEKIKAGKGDYVLAVKGNQRNLYDDLIQYFNDSELKSKCLSKKTTEKAHGQIESRVYYQTDDIKWLSSKKEWKGIQSIGIVETTITKNNRKTTEIRYYTSSLTPNIDLFAESVRGHWSVESMHWHLDVTFREDKNQTLEKTAAENLNIFRKRALSILKLFELDKKYSLKKKRFALSCNFALYLDKVMAI